MVSGNPREVGEKLNSRPPPQPRGSPTAGAFLERVESLTASQWRGVLARATSLGAELNRQDLVRGAVVAITVRRTLSKRHFDVLYMPFADAIPFGSLPPSDESRG